MLLMEKLFKIFMFTTYFNIFHWNTIFINNIFINNYYVMFSVLISVFDQSSVVY